MWSKVGVANRVFICAPPLFISAYGPAIEMNIVCCKVIQNNTTAYSYVLERIKYPNRNEHVAMQSQPTKGGMKYPNKMNMLQK